MRDMLERRGQVGATNRILAALAGLTAVVTILIWGVPGLDPTQWDAVAVVSGLRPARELLPGLWRVLTGWMFAVFGMDAALNILSVIGVLVAGICTYSVYIIVRQILALLIRTGRPYAVWGKRIAPGFAFLAALLFGISSPLAHISQTFSPDGLRLLIFLLVVHFSLRWFTTGGEWRLYPAVALMGVLAAESPLGFVVPLVFAGAYVTVWHCVIDGLLPPPEGLPEPGGVPKWRVFFLFLGTLIVMAWINVMFFVSLNGADAQGWDLAGAFCHYATAYWRLLAGSSSFLGWVLGFGFCVLPFFVALRIFPIAVRDDRPMFFPAGVLLFFVGLLTVLQTGAIPSGRFWTFATETTMVRSGFLLAIFCFCAMATVAFVGAAFAFECQRKYLGQETEDDELSIGKPGLALRLLVPVIGAGIFLLALRTIPKPVETEMQRIVDAVVEETVEECGDAEWLFTDGRLDPAVEIAAAKRGKSLWALNLMSSSAPWDVYVRCRNFAPGSPDHQLVETGVPVLLRVWADERTNGLDKAALQIGFAFWKRARKPLPRLSGVVARETGMSEDEAEKGIARTKALAERIRALGNEPEHADATPALKEAFTAVNWRIARFARLREDSETADGLDEVNGVLRKLMTVIDDERQRTFMQLTPREGLEIALRRANYAEARRYAMVVLKNDEDDPQANFALGISAIMDKRLSDAELYLRRSLKRCPNDPAVLNNLSIICRKQGKYKDAEAFARRALEILPDAKEIQNTLKDALKKAP